MNLDEAFIELEEHGYQLNEWKITPDFAELKDEDQKLLTKAMNGLYTAKKSGNQKNIEKYTSVVKTISDKLTHTKAKAKLARMIGNVSAPSAATKSALAAPTKAPEIDPAFLWICTWRLDTRRHDIKSDIEQKTMESVWPVRQRLEKKIELLKQKYPEYKDYFFIFENSDSEDDCYEWGYFAVPKALNSSLIKDQEELNSKLHEYHKFKWDGYCKTWNVKQEFENTDPNAIRYTIFNTCKDLLRKMLWER